MSEELKRQFEIHAEGLLGSGHFLVLGSRMENKWAKVRPSDAEVVDWISEEVRELAVHAAEPVDSDSHVPDRFRGVVRTYRILHSAQQAGIECSWEKPGYRLANRYWSDTIHYVDEYCRLHGKYHSYPPVDPKPENLGAFMEAEYRRHETLTAAWRAHYSALSCLFSFCDAAFFDAADALLENESLAEMMGRSPQKWEMLAAFMRRPLQLDKEQRKAEEEARAARNRLVHLPLRLKRKVQGSSAIRSMLTPPETLRAWYAAVGDLTESRCASVGYELKREQRETFPE